MLYINQTVNTNLEIKSLMDLTKLKAMSDNSNIKVNMTEIARELDCDRRTCKKYYDGFTKAKSRKKPSQFDDYYVTIKELLSDDTRLFRYKNNLFNFMKDNHNMPGAKSSFRRYLSITPEFNDYFNSKGLTKPNSNVDDSIDNVNSEKEKYTNRVSSSKSMRYETGFGEQAQIDWKESQVFTLNDGTNILLNVLVFLLSNSRFKLFHVSLLKTQDVLLHFLDRSFDIIGGVPKTIVTDNMKTVMDVSRTNYRKGVVNKVFQNFADDYGFEVHPCIARRPETKSKVETQMKILDEIYAYNGHISYEQLVLLITNINERENTAYHPYYKKIPLLALEKEKDFLLPLPKESIRNHYQIKSSIVKVNKSSLINYLSSQYSVPPKYIGEKVTIEAIDNIIYIYYNKKIIATHNISIRTLNYHEDHYIEITKLTLGFDDEKIREIAKENLKKIGESFT